jgi:hypothetical protein
VSQNTFGYVWLSVYDVAGAAKRMTAIQGLGAERMARFKSSGGGMTTLGVQPPIPPDAAASRTQAAAAPAIRVMFTEGTLERSDTHLFELSRVFATEKEATDWLDEWRDVTSAGFSNRVLLTVSAKPAQQ